VLGTFRSALTSPTAAFAPLWLAIESGAFADNGVDLQLITATTSAAAAALASGQLDGLFNSSPTIVSADAAGLDLIMVGSLLDRQLFSTYAAPAISGAAQLKGRPFGCGMAGTPVEFGCLTALTQLGLTPDDVQLRRLDTIEQLYAALASNQVDAAVLQPPQTFAAEQNGFRRITEVPQTPFQSIGLTVRRGQLDQLKPVLPGMLRALQSGIRRFAADREFAIQVMAKYTQDPDTDRLNKTYDFFKQVGFRENMLVDRDGLLTVIDFLRPSDPRVAALMVDDLYDNTYARDLK
jgi:ABC-type nitrate/sulfonate/bicarbonate transport system substrate-binding protein